MKFVPVVFLAVLATTWPSNLMAQEAPAVSEVAQEAAAPQAIAPDVIAQESPTPRPPFVERLLKDQRDLWRAPFNIKRSDMKWLVPLGVGAAVLVTKDRDLSNGARSAEGIRPASRALSNLGGGGPMIIASGTMWGVGKLTGNPRVAKTGQMAAEAVFHTELAVRGLKTIFNRERPSKIDGQGQFWGGGRSFPSGHAATSFAFATVVAREYKDKPWIRFGAYGLATAVSLSRVGGLNHFPTDVVIGATIGHLIGRFIFNRHKDE